jgi:hypothetical protein
MRAKELTNKEQRFAKAAAAGATQAAAYAAAYSDKARAATQRANGHRIAKKPHVAAEIKRLRRLPAADDYAGIKKQMIERLLELAENDKNSVAQHRAIVTLIKYADEGAVRPAAKNPVPNIEELLRELSAGVEAESSEDRIADGGTIAAGDLTRTLPVQIKDDCRVVPAKQELPRPVNAAEAYRVNREAEIRAHQEYIRQSRAEVERLTALYRQQQETAGPTLSEPANEDGLVGETDRDPSIDGSACVAVQRQGGTRPGFRREMIPGRFPPQYRWVPLVEGEGLKVCRNGEQDCQYTQIV